MDKPVNLASLPEDVALARARAGGRAVFSDEDLVSGIHQDLRAAWMTKHMPKACGQSDDEFGDLVEKVCDEFDAGVDEGVTAARAEGRTKRVLERLEELLLEQCSLAWRVYNVLAFMAEALPDDEVGELPVKCTCIELRGDAYKLGESLLDLSYRAQNDDASANGHRVGDDNE